MAIGRKDPLQYLKERYAWTTHEIVRERLHSHLIPINEMTNGGYEGLTEQAKKEKIKNDFETFLQKRADLVIKTVSLLVAGRLINTSNILQDLEKEGESSRISMVMP